MKLNHYRKSGRLFSGCLTAVLLIGAVTLLSGCGHGNWSFGDGRIEGNGKMIDEEYTLAAADSITKLDLSEISATVNLSATATDQITYSIDDNLSKFLEINETNGVLEIKSSDKRLLGRNRAITFNIGIATLEELEIFGDVEINGQGTFTTERFEAEIAGAAEVDMIFDVTDMLIDAAGAAKLNLSGKTENLEIRCDGAASVSARHLIAGDVSVTTNGASELEIYAEDNLDINGAGVGSVVYWGDPSLSRSVMGFSSVKKGD